jgi:hypothetical protein
MVSSTKIFEAKAKIRLGLNNVRLCFQRLAVEISIRSLVPDMYCVVQTDILPCGP